MGSVADETEAYAAYLNAAVTDRFESPESHALLLEDLARARRMMEIAWLLAQQEA